MSCHVSIQKNRDGGAPIFTRQIFDVFRHENVVMGERDEKIPFNRSKGQVQYAVSDS